MHDDRVGRLVRRFRSRDRAALHAIAREVLNGVDPAKASFAGNKGVGDFLKTRIFTPGRSLDWNGLTKHATGEALNAKAFAAEIGRE